jgi:hypothetical protein
MTLFLPQFRVPRNETGAPLPDFPADVTGTITLAPEDAFGVEGAASRTVLPLGTVPRIWGDFNEGRSWVEGGLLDPLTAVFTSLDPVGDSRSGCTSRTHRRA